MPIKKIDKERRARAESKKSDFGKADSRNADSKKSASNKSSTLKSSAKKAESKRLDSSAKSMRLNAFISHNCPYSRREADALIAQGRVNIGRQKASLGDTIRQGDKVFIDEKYIKPLDQEKYTLIIYHKPKGELVIKKDDRGRRVIYDGLGAKYRGFVPVGRLDYASEGLLILSDSKRVASALMQSSLEREYILKIDSSVDKAMEEAMSEGLQIRDKAGAHKLSKITQMDIKPFVGYEILKNTPRFSRLKVTINEGQNRELRRFFAHFKASVLDLRRVRYGFVHLNALPEGKTRFFSKDEYKQLHEFMRAFESKEGKAKSRE